MLKDVGGHDEIERAYIQRFALARDLPAARKSRALYLLGLVSKLRRLDFTDRGLALQGVESVQRRLIETRVFHPSDHDGYNEMIAFVMESLSSLKARVDEKFPK